MRRGNRSELRDRSRGPTQIGNNFALISGMGLGAGLMYLLDPDRGRRRRALARDKAVAVLHETQDALDKGMRDLLQRGQGALAESWSALRGEQVSDPVLEERVRAKLGRSVSHPSSVEVRAENGTVHLSGHVLEAEVDNLIDSVSAVRGVRHIENKLQRHKERGNIPELQGGRGRPGERSELMQVSWAPGTRLLLGTTGGLLAMAGFRRGSLRGFLGGLAGLGLLARSLTNMELGRLIGARGGRRGIEVQRTLEINAPVEEVYSFWSNVENLPKVMVHLREMRRTGERGYHCEAVGPAGIPFSWDGEFTQTVPNQLIAWRTLPGSLVRNAGIIRFQPAEGGTRLHARITYNPPGGAVGQAVASLFGADPEASLINTLARFKSLMEQGKTTGAHGETITRERPAS